MIMKKIDNYEMHSVVEYDTATKRINTLDLCPLVCEYKNNVLDNMEALLNNPSYDVSEDGVLLSTCCEKKLSRRCVIEIIPLTK